MNKIAKWTATLWFGLQVPRGGGTIGAALAVPVAWPMTKFSWPIQLAFVTLVSLASYGMIAQYLTDHPAKDPPEVILDEFAGCLVALLFLPWHWPSILGGFVLFRLFDIWKPWPVGPTERIPGAAGVLLDDLVAGVMARATLWGFRYLLCYFWATC